MGPGSWHRSADSSPTEFNTEAAIQPGIQDLPVQFRKQYKPDRFIRLTSHVSRHTSPQWRGPETDTDAVVANEESIGGSCDTGHGAR